MTQDANDRWALLRIRLSEQAAHTAVCKVDTRKGVRRAGYAEIAEHDPALARRWRHGNLEEVSDGGLLWAAIPLGEDPDELTNEVFYWVQSRIDQMSP